MAKFEDIDVGQSVTVGDDPMVYEITAWNQTRTKVWIGCRISGGELRFVQLVPIESVERWVE